VIKFNESLAAELGVDTRGLESDEVASLFAGNVIPPGEPIAMAYAAHQFSNFVPQLGDGRAILLGEVVARHGGRRCDIDRRSRDSGRAACRRAFVTLTPPVDQSRRFRFLHAAGLRQDLSRGQKSPHEHPRHRGADDRGCERPGAPALRRTSCSPTLCSRRPRRCFRTSRISSVLGRLAADAGEAPPNPRCRQMKVLLRH
jgi:Protein adenylyltransferase SelO